MTLVAPRIVNDLPYVSTVNHDIHFEWQAPYLLRCVGDACSIYFTGNICASCLCVSAHYTTKFVSPRSISSSNIILSSHPTAQAFRFPCSACAAVGCALPRLHPMYRDLRCSAVRTLLRAARCLRRIRPS